MPSDIKGQLKVITEIIKDKSVKAVQIAIESKRQEAENILKQTYLDLGVYDTGKSQKNSKVTYTPTKEGATLSFSTGSFSNVDYIPYWFFGLGSNRGKGARQTVLTAAGKFLNQSLDSLEFTLPEKD